MNLYSSPQETALTLYPGSPQEIALGHISLEAMEVRQIILEKTV